MAASNLILSISEIPDEGLHLKGQLPASVFDLRDQLAKAKAPLHYDLQVFLADEFVVLTGWVTVLFELRCARSSQMFEYEVRLDSYQESVELENPEFIDLTDRIREDTLLALPAYPTSPESEASFPVSKPEQHRSEGDSEGPSAWDALDGLQTNQ